MDATIMESRFKPKALKRGDLVEIVSPASAIDVKDVDDATKLLLGQGYRVRLSENALERNGFLAGSDEQRAADLQTAFSDEEVAAVYCARGGYGCARLFPFLDLDMLAKSRKMFLRTLIGDLSIPVGTPRADTVVGGMAEGPVTGGCLCLIGDSIGTADEIDASGKIVVIEDVDEMPHRVDAMLTHLLNSGIVQKAAGIAVGEMTRTDEHADPKIGAASWTEIVTERLKPLGVPFVINYPFGHMKNMLSVPFGIRARLDADAGTLTYTEALCAE